MGKKWEILFEGKLVRRAESAKECARLCRWKMDDPRYVIRKRLKKKHRKILA